MWVFLVAILVLNAIILWRCRKLKDGKFLIIIWLIAFGLRLAGTILFNVYIYEGQYEHPDSSHWDNNAIRKISKLGQGNIQDLSSPNYPLIIGIIYAIFGQHNLIPSFFNISLSSWTIVLLYTLAARIFSQKVARITAILATVHPGLIYWPIQHLKEAYILFLLALTFFTFIPKEKKYEFSNLVWASIITGLIYFSRFKIALIASATLLFGSLILQSRKKLSSIAFASIIFFWIFVLAFSSYQSILEEKISILPKDLLTDTLATLNKATTRSSTVESHRRFFDENLAPLKIDTIKDVAASFPKGMFRFFTYPFPWKAKNGFEIVFGIYITWWYILLPFVAYGIWLSIKEKNRKAWIPLAFAAQTSIGLGMIVNAVGPLIRWREMAFTFLLMFGAKGIWEIIRKNRRK